MSQTYEHARDVLFWASEHIATSQGCALAVVTDTEGGAVRAPGALMAISADGSSTGYLSGGCIDADVVQHALVAIQSNQTRKLRYGVGSPFVDIQLPCGGAIEILLTPHLNEAVMRNACLSLDQRQTATIELPKANTPICSAEADTITGWRGAVFTSCYRPKLRLRIAGRGADVVALANVASAGGISCIVESPDEACLSAAERSGADRIVKLETPGAIRANEDDASTAFALMFHDPHWENSLLQDALCGDAFYIGAVGSRRTQLRRREALAAAGVSSDDIARIRGPIGLVPSMRDASMLAISALAEIIEAFHVDNI